MEGKETPKRTRSPWLERGIFLAVILMLGVWLTYDRLFDVPHSVVVDGTPVATLESRHEAKSVLQAVKSRQLADRKLSSAAFEQPVAVKRAAGNAEVSPVEDAVSRLDQILVLKAQAYAILVDGTVATALPKEDEALRALDLAKEKYAERLKSLYSRPAIKEPISVDRRYLAVKNIAATPEAAADYLTAVHEKPKYHTIVRGDRAVRITAKYGISLDELKKLNPGINVDRLTEGDRLLVGRPKPPVTVVTKTLTTKVTPIKSPAERGVPAKTGKRQTSLVITYENGVQVGEEAIRVMTTWDKPVPTRR